MIPNHSNQCPYKETNYLVYYTMHIAHFPLTINHTNPFNIQNIWVTTADKIMSVHKKFLKRFKLVTFYRSNDNWRTWILSHLWMPGIQFGNPWAKCIAVVKTTGDQSTSQRNECYGMVNVLNSLVEGRMTYSTENWTKASRQKSEALQMLEMVG